MSAQSSVAYRFGPFELSPARRELHGNGEAIGLTPKAFDILVLLVESQGALLSKGEVMRRIWAGTNVDESNLSQHVFQIRKALGLQADGREYIETVPRHGYRFMANVERTEPPSAIRSVVPAQPGGELGGTARGRLYALFVAVVVVAALSVYSAASYIHRRAVQKPGKIMLAVLPLENLSGDADQEYFSDGLTEEMITQLGNLEPRRLGVIARTSAMQYKGTGKSTHEIGRELGVNYILEGSVRRDGDQVRVSAQLIQVQDQTQIWAQDYDRRLSDILSLQSDIARAIARQIALKLAPEATAALAENRQIDPQTYELYLKGRYFWNQRTPSSLRESIGYFEQAIERDPRYAQAYAGLADSYLLLGPNDVLPTRQVYPQAKQAALKALEINESLAEAHASLGFIRLLYDWDPLSAEKEFRRAIELNPSYPTAHHWYAYDLMALGRPQESLREIHAASELDPLSAIINADWGQLLMFAHKDPEAAAQLRKAAHLNPDFAQTYWYEGLLYMHDKNYTQAFSALLDDARLSGIELSQIDAFRDAYRSAGIDGYWKQQLTFLQARSGAHHASAYTLAVIYAEMDKRNETLANLERAYQNHYPSLVFLAEEPVFENLHSDPRFAVLLRQIASSSRSHSVPIR